MISPGNSENKAQAALLDHSQREPTADAQFLMNLSPQLESLSLKSNLKAKTEIKIFCTNTNSKIRVIHRINEHIFYII